MQALLVAAPLWYLFWRVDVLLIICSIEVSAVQLMFTLALSFM
jgi:hypothetical protein